MNLSVTYKKNANSNIEVCISVADREDFNTIYIFYDDSDYPTNKDYQLDFKYCSQISKTCMNLKTAKQWTEEQITALKALLQNWRNIPTNTNKTTYKI